MNTLTIRIGTRGSQLALWQANHVAALLRDNGHAVEIEVIRTAGDRLQTEPAGLSPNTGAGPLGPLGIGATGIFIKEIEEALAAGRIDLAVHSLKDLPTEIDPRFTLAAIPPRADARDAFVCESSWGLHMLPSGARIATTSPRRQAMVLALRPDITFVEMRGNIDTRLRKWEAGEADALILACAGLDRLGLTEHVHQRFSVDELTPAPGQGALALQVRNAPMLPETSAALKGTGFSPSVSAAEEQWALAPEESTRRDALIHAAVRALNCGTTEYAVTAERAVLHALGGGCQLPLGAFCHKVTTSTNGIDVEAWHLHAMVVSPDGDQSAHVLRKSPLSTPAELLGQSVAEALKARGALELLSTEMLEQSTAQP